MRGALIVSFLLLKFCNCLLAVEPEDMLFVIEDSIPMRMEPAQDAFVVKYFPKSFQFRVLKVTKDQKWLKVILNDGGYGLWNWYEEYWISNKNLYMEPEKSDVEIKFDVSLWENGDLQNARRIRFMDYLDKFKSISLEPPCYVSALYSTRSQKLPGSRPLSIAAYIWNLADYFSLVRSAWNERIAAGDTSFDTDEFDEYLRRHRVLYGTGKVTPFFHLSSEKEIKSVRLNLESVKIVVDDPGCYPDKFIGVECETLVDTAYSVNNKYFFSSRQIDTDYFFVTELAGGVQNVKLLYSFKITYKDNSEENIVIRLVIGWPKCL